MGEGAGLPAIWRQTSQLLPNSNIEGVESTIPEFLPGILLELNQRSKRFPQGYNYPVPDNPLTLPTKPTTTSAPTTTTGSTTVSYNLPVCINKDEKDTEENKELIGFGVPICPDEE